MTHMININGSTRTSEEDNLHEGLNTWDSPPFVCTTEEASWVRDETFSHRKEVQLLSFSTS